MYLKVIVQRNGGEYLFYMISRGCPLLLHKLQVDLLGRLGEAGDFWHGHQNFAPPRS